MGIILQLMLLSRVFITENNILCYVTTIDNSINTTVVLYVSIQQSSDRPVQTVSRKAEGNNLERPEGCAQGSRGWKFEGVRNF